MKQMTPARAPMLWLLLGLLAGLILARHFWVPLPLLLSLALIGSLITLYCSRTQALRRQWIACFLISATLCFWAYAQIRLPSAPSAFNRALPKREAQLSIQLQRLMQPGTVNRKPSGLARVLNAPTTSRLQPGDLIYFRLTLPPMHESAKHIPTNIQRGLRIRVTGILSPIQIPAANAANTDFNHYLKGIGVHYRFERTGRIETLREPMAFDRFCAAMNQRFQQTLRLGAPPDSQLPNVYVAMLLGRKIELTKAQLERYRTTGTIHFFAISGLHIGMIATVIAQFLLLLRVPRWLSPLIGLPLLYLYVEITGGSPSAVRAFLMAVFFWSSFALQRQHSPFSALISSAIFVLLMDPKQVWSLGFQLSYAVVASILLFGLPLYRLLTQQLQPYRWLPDRNRRFYQRGLAWSLDKILLLLAISSSAWLASTPLSAGLFELIAPGAILVNMILVYLVAIVISGGIISLAYAIVYLPAIAEFINHSAWIVIYLIDQIVILNTQIPGAILPTKGFPPLLGHAALTAYFITLLWLHHHPPRLRAAAMCLPPVIILGTLLVGLQMID